MYVDLNSLKSLLEDNEYKITIMANSSSFLFNSLNDINWLGFYLLNDNSLYLGPFQGKPACIKIPVGKGVCGNTIKNNEVTIVQNVLKYPGHIACDSNSKSELCIPIIINNKIYGLLDIDSPSFNRFNDEIVNELKEAVKIIELALEDAK